MSQFVVGVDIGKAADFTAINVMELVQKGTGYEYHIRYLERPPKGTTYPEIIEKIKAVINLPAISHDCTLVVDATGVGAPVVDLLRETDPLLIAITIHGGAAVNKVNNYAYNVPKRDLVSNLQVLYQNKQIKISNQIKEAELLINELLNFKVKISASGHDSYEAWREGIHDDLVLSACLSAWWHEKNRFSFSLPDFSGSHDTYYEDQYNNY